MGFILWESEAFPYFSQRRQKKVLGVEIVPEAIEDARLNAKINEN